MSKSEIISGVLLLVSIIAFFYGLKYANKFYRVEVDSLKNSLNKLDGKVDTLSNDFKEHINAKSPHKGCASHTAGLITLQNALALKVDSSLCNEIHKATNKRLDQMCEDLAALRQVVTDNLAPLGSIAETLSRVERKLDKE